MKPNILDNPAQIAKLDSQNMRGSLERLGQQIEQVWRQSAGLKIPASYKTTSHIVVLGMGGSALGARVIKSLFFNELKAPLEIVNGYHLPEFVNARSLVLVSSYSGTTEEPLAALSEARRRRAKLLAITSGGALAEVSRRAKIPALIFTTENNPCGSPRMGLGYLIVGAMILLAKAGVLSFRHSAARQLIKTIERFQNVFGIPAGSNHNRAKQIAGKTLGRSVWYVAAEHLAGNAQVAANQMNENGKRFAASFAVPEMNHHLLEGMRFPRSNHDNLLFILIKSDLYEDKIKQRLDLTKRVLDKNNIVNVGYLCRSRTKPEQAAEVLLFSSYVSFYSALVQGIDPTAIPFVDFFKEQLKKT